MPMDQMRMLGAGKTLFLRKRNGMELDVEVCLMYPDGWYQGLTKQLGNGVESSVI